MQGVTRSQEPTRVAVLGAGGVGGYFGGRLASSGAADVSFIARGRHLKALRERGLRVRSPLGDFECAAHASDDPSTIGPCDYVLFCVKSFDTESASDHLPALVGANTAVVSFQNGIDNEEKIAHAVGWPHVMGGAAFIFSTVTEPGFVVHTGGPARLIFGEMDGERTPRASHLLEICRQAGISAEASDDVRRVLWNKFVFICAQAGFTSAARLPIGAIRDAPESWQAFRLLLEEAASVARAVGVDLGEQAIEGHMDFASSLEADSYSSLYHDLNGGRRTELEALHGTLVRLADEHGIAVPASRIVYALLKLWALRNERLLTGL